MVKIGKKIDALSSIIQILYSLTIVLENEMIEMGQLMWKKVKIKPHMQRLKN